VTTDMPASPPSPADDFSLMAAIAQGDSVAFKTFYDRHSSIVYTLALRMLKSPQEAEQLLTDVFFEIWSARERYDHERANPLTYLMRLTRSRAIDRLRRKGPVGANAGVSLDPAAGIDVPIDAPPASTIEAGEERQRIAAALDTLDQEHRRILECAYYDGLSHSEIAERLNKPLGTVKSSIRIGLAKLKDLLRTP
jgi:RNA polymerase sigma-70 factor (ECF subfamily)